MLRIANHIASAEPVREGSHLYKALRSDGRISAVEVFPFEMTAEQYHVFKQQVNLLTEVVSHHRASTPAILSRGYTQTGNFSFIEREWIEGPDLTQFSDNEKRITVDEVGTIAEQMSRVLTLCHSAGVVHSNINSRHILWDKQRGQYSLTGFRFGLQSSDPASKMMRADASQQELFFKEKDIRDLGLVLFQLLQEHLLTGAGIKSTSPGSLANQQLKDGSTMPAWLVTCLERALSTNEERFTSAHEMYSYIILHHKTPLPANKWYRSKPQQPSKVLLRTEVKTERTSRQKLQSAWTSGVRKGREEMRFVFDRSIAVGLVIAGVLAGFSIIAQKREHEKVRESRIGMSTNTPQQDTPPTDEEIKEPVVAIRTQKNPEPPEQEKKKTVTPKKADKKEIPVEKLPADHSLTEQEENNGDIGSYKVRSKAYFHNQPDEATKRNAFIVHWNNAVLRPLKEENDFVYVVFTNHEGQTSKGWLRKKDLVKL